MAHTGDDIDQPGQENEILAQTLLRNDFAIGESGKIVLIFRDLALIHLVIQWLMM